MIAGKSPDAVRGAKQLFLHTRQASETDALALEAKIQRQLLGRPNQMEAVMAVSGWQKEDFPLAEELPTDQQSLALCHGRIQAGVYAVSHPYAVLGRTIALCDAVLTDVSAAVIAKLVAASPFYVPTEIPQGLYVGQTAPTRTFGLPVTVVTSSQTQADTVHALLSALFADLEQLRQMHPVLAGLEPPRMLRDGLTAPLHEGAERYARQRGWQ